RFGVLEHPGPRLFRSGSKRPSTWPQRDRWSSEFFRTTVLRVLQRGSEAMSEPWIVKLDAANPSKFIVPHTNQTAKWYLQISNYGPSAIGMTSDGTGETGLAPGDTMVSDAKTGFAVRLVMLGGDPKQCAIVRIEVLGQIG